MEKVLVTQEEIKELKNIETETNTLALALGSIDIQIHQLKERKIELFKKLNDIKNKENILASKLSEKYGSGSIDLETGEFVKTV